VQGGIVVRGVAGRRHEYRPLVSRLTDSCEPAAVADAFRRHFGLTELYLADLDALAGTAPAVALYRSLSGFRLWVDAGLRRAPDAAPLVDAGVDSLVAGLETLAGPDELAALCRADGSRVVFSLDLRQGRPLGDWGDDPMAVAAEVVGAGCRRLLVLDLARVGVGAGTGTEDFCRGLAEAYPDVTLTAGGGIRDAADLLRLAACGVRSALVASALHDGRLSPLSPGFAGERGWE